MPDWLSFVDVLFVTVVLLFAWSGFQKGFAGQVAHILTFGIAGVFLFFAYPAIFHYLGRIFRNVNETYLMWLLLAGLFFLAVLLFLFFSKMLASLLKTQITDGADRSYGFILGLIRGLLVTMITLILLVMLDSSGKTFDRIRTKSYVGQFVCYELVPRIQPRLAPALEDNVRKWKNQLLEREEAGQLD